VCGATGAKVGASPPQSTHAAVPFIGKNKQTPLFALHGADAVLSLQGALAAPEHPKGSEAAEGRSLHGDS
jgi:hypothetical protein